MLDLHHSERWYSLAWDVWLGGWLSAAEIDRRREQRLRELVSFARRHVPLYRALYRQLPADPAHPVDLAQLPVMTKRDLMRDLEASVSDRAIKRTALCRFIADVGCVGRLFRGRYAVWTTSGTSGEPGIFLHDADALAVYDALEMFRFRRLASPVELALAATGERFAMVAATGGHFAGVATVERLRRAYPWLAATTRAFTLLQPWPALVAQLNAYRPTHLSTYPTAAEVLADEQQAGRLRLDLRELWTGGECLSSAEKRYLQREFGCRVRNSYGASEFLSIAWDCGHGSLHVNADWVILEPVDAQYRPVPPGSPSHTVLLTNLANRVQPLIRYDLGDSLTVHTEPCCCGSALPAICVEGRDDDILVFDDRRGQSVKLLPLVLTTVLEEEALVNDFQLVQTTPHCLRVRLGRPARASEERACGALRGYLQRLGLAGVTVRVDARPPQRSQVSGKLRRVLRAFGAAPDRSGGGRCERGAESHG